MIKLKYLPFLIFPFILFLFSSCLSFLNKPSHQIRSQVGAQAGPQAELQGSTPSITSFAFNLQRTATIFSPINSSNFKKFIPVDFPPGHKAVAPMPLYLNNYDGKKLLFFGTRDQQLISFDLRNNKQNWIYKFPQGSLFSTPTIDEEKKRIYALTQEVIPLAHPHPLNEMIKGQLNYYLYSLDLNGHFIDYHKIDVSKFLQEAVPWKISDPPIPSLLCRTALTLQNINGHDVIKFGCSILSNLPQGFKYGLKRGYRGILVSIPLDSKGHFLLKNKKLFFPSAAATGLSSSQNLWKKTAYDTGIYHGGSGLAILPDQSFLVATGNGPFLPELKNYGCSVVRLDPVSLQPVSPTPPSPEFYSVDDKGFQECHTANMDLTSSAVSILKMGSHLYGSIGGKDGRLRIFNPYNLPGDDPKKKKEVKISDLPIYGGPAIFVGLDNRPNIVASFNHRLFSKDNLPKEIVSDQTSDQVNDKIINKHENELLCIGLIARDKIDDGQPLSLYYSGKLRDDYVIAVSGKTFGKKAFYNSKGYNYFESFVRDEWEPFHEIERIGYSYSAKSKNLPQGYSLQKLETFAMVNNLKGWTFAMEFISTTEESNKKMGSLLSKFEKALAKKAASFSFDKLSQDNGYILSTQYSPVNGFCGSNHKPHLKRIYLKMNNSSKRAGWGVTSWKIDEKGKLVNKWNYHGGPEYKAHSTTPVVTLSHSQNPGIVIMSAGSESSNHKNMNSILSILNSETGELLQKIPFIGNPHFTMPIIIEDKIFVPTLDNGLLLFRHTHIPKFK